MPPSAEVVDQNGGPTPNGVVSSNEPVKMNGSDKKAKSAERLAVWNSVSKWLPSRTSDEDYWWNLTGPQLAFLLASADYSVTTQFETLLFYWRHIIPILGSAATAGGTGPSPTTEDGTRIEFSWRWSEGNKPPEIRTAFDPFSRATGTLKDPLGIVGGMDIFHNLAPHNPDINLEFVYEFLERMYDSPHQLYMKHDGSAMPNHMGMGFEFGQQNFLPKVYFRPRKTLQEDKTAPLTFEDWETIITDAFGAKPAVRSSLDFIKNKANLGLTLNPIYVGVDIVKSLDGRMKLYCLEAKTSFNSMRSILTMGGTIDVPETDLDSVWELVRGLCGLPDDFPKDQELPRSAATLPESTSNDRSTLWKYLGYYFEVGPNRDTPDVKLYIPTTWYGVNDQVVADTTVRWMEKNGREKYVPAFWESLEALSPHRRLDDGIGIMLWLALMYKNGSLQVTTYFAPEAYHPKRFEKTE